MDNFTFHIDWDVFHFLRPGLLWLFLPLAVALILGLIGLREEVRWKKIISPHLRPFMIKRGSESFKRWMQLLAFVVAAFGILGVSGPAWRKIELPDRTLETPLVIALDLSQSMLATDLQPTRLERAKFKIQDLLKANPRARSALIGFAGTAHTLVPLTNDYSIILSHLMNLSPSVLPFPGTDQQAALMLADSLVAATEAPGTLLLITDQCTDETFEQLQEYALNASLTVKVMPMGTSRGAIVPMGSTNRPMRDDKGEIVESSIDRQVLQRMDALEGVDIVELTLDNSDMESLAAEISKNLEFRDETENLEENWQDEGFWFLIPLAIFLLFWFRRGWVIYSIASLVFFNSCAPDNKLGALWFSNDYRGQKFYDLGRFEEAAEVFESPMRKGLAYYKGGNYQEAILAFARDSTANGYYNLGLAYYQSGDLERAREAFRMAAEADPALSAATQNLNITENLIQNRRDQLGQAEEAPVAGEEAAENIQNTDPEDLGGGGQEATEEDMKTERKEETVATDTRMGKELEEVPEDFSADRSDQSQKVLMRKVDDDPSLFLKRKLSHQVRVQGIKPRNSTIKW